MTTIGPSPFSSSRCSIRWTMAGSRNAAVFPLPVLASPRMSLHSGRVRCVVGQHSLPTWRALPKTSKIPLKSTPNKIRTGQTRRREGPGPGWAWAPSNLPWPSRTAGRHRGRSLQTTGPAWEGRSQRREYPAASGVHSLRPGSALAARQARRTDPLQNLRTKWICGPMVPGAPLQTCHLQGRGAGV